ncbi:MAG: mannan-binding lectin [Myxococcota bacterium]
MWNNNDAKKKCPMVCKRKSTSWNGQWKTTVRGKVSVCGCCK